MSLATRLQDLATRAGTEAKALRTLINGNAADLSALTTTAKSSLVAAINEVKASVASAAGISDGTTSTSTTWSSSKISNSIGNAVAGLVNGSQATLDTLKELADAIGNDPNYAASISTALGLRVRVDAAQSLTGPQQAQGRTNIGAASSADVGDPNADGVTAFETALA